MGRLSHVQIYMAWFFFVGQLAFLVNLVGGLLHKRQVGRNLAGRIKTNT